MRCLRAGLLMVLIGASSNTWAQNEAGPTLGVALGPARIQAPQFTASDAVAEFSAGFRLSTYLAVEAAWFISEYSREQPAFETNFPRNEAVQLAGYSLALLGEYPLSEIWGLTARVAVLDWTLERELVDDADGRDIWPGLGGYRQLGHSARLRFEFRHATLGTVEHSTALFGYQYRFGAAQNR